MTLYNLKIDRNWTLFLDRDGTINRRIVDTYAKEWTQFEFIPGVKDAMHAFSEIFGKIIVVTNQQGIGKGLMTEDDVNGIHQKMTLEIEQAGGHIDAIFFSPYLKSDHNFHRKPAVGMALQARKKFPEIRLNRSIMAGDSISDMIFGKRSGMKTVLLSHDPALAKQHPKLVDFFFPDLISFAHAL
ncbi:MAG: HAD-IIIA family hydrolase [Bacteroidales bacterium]|jgi:histidinol-phosphate phosphatase family protein|nr:HAD-IIIA family hydrolase [Bacteroidales bacterium]